MLYCHYEAKKTWSFYNIFGWDFSSLKKMCRGSKKAEKQRKTSVSWTKSQWAGVDRKGAGWHGEHCHMVRRDMTTPQSECSVRGRSSVEGQKSLDVVVPLQLSVFDPSRLQQNRIENWKSHVIHVCPNCCFSWCWNSQPCLDVAFFCCFFPLALSLQTEAPGLSLGCCVDLIPQVKVILASKYEE